MKKNTIIYWVSTSFIFLFDTIMPALYSNTQIAVEGIRHLGFPDYFRVELTVFKIIGGLLLIVPQVPARFKEWAYVGFGINFISAAVAHAAIDGVGAQTFLPLVLFAILITSYLSYHRITKVQMPAFA
jgi:hypothetical protein